MYQTLYKTIFSVYKPPSYTLVTLQMVKKEYIISFYFRMTGQLGSTCNLFSLFLHSLLLATYLGADTSSILLSHLFLTPIHFSAMEGVMLLLYNEKRVLVLLLLLCLNLSSPSIQKFHLVKEDIKSFSLPSNLRSLSAWEKHTVHTVK